MKNIQDYTDPNDFYKDLVLDIIKWADWDTFRRWDPEHYIIKEDIEYAEESLQELADWVRVQVNDTYLLRGT